MSDAGVGNVSVDDDEYEEEGEGFQGLASSSSSSRRSTCIAWGVRRLQSSEVSVEK